MNSYWYILVVCFLVGCSSSGGGSGGFSYSQSARFAGDMRNQHYATIDGQLNKVQLPGMVEQSRVKVKFCPATGQSRWAYTCDNGCTGFDGCVHASNRTQPGSSATEYMYAGTQPHQEVISHETVHYIFAWQADDPAQIWNHPSGHPEKVTINGVSYKAKYLMGRGRWPMWVMKTADVVNPLWSDDWGKTYSNCIHTLDSAGSINNVLNREENK